MKRYALVTISVSGFLALAAASLPASAAIRGSSGAGAPRAAAQKYLAEPLCQSNKSLCADAYTHDGGEYVGHDEPSLLFKSNAPGSGNNMTYTMTLPKDPKKQPNASGKGGSTWNFQLRPTFWFGLTLCDTESAPEFTKTCKPDSNRNNLVGTNPGSANYIGKHPGAAFMELQFYGPGYVPQFEGFGCAARVYCAAMTIDSLTVDQNHGTGSGTENTAACNNFVLGGAEPINWAYVTKSGKSQAPANPLFTGTLTNPNFKAVNPNLTKDLLMRPGDRIRIHMHDTKAGFQVNLTDLTTGKHGSMTASVANGFGHILFTPKSKTCQEAPYAFHPEYSTANVRGTTWSAHTYNAAMSDEIGHFENCLTVNAQGVCTKPGAQDPGGPDSDDNGCVPGTDSTVVHINGCFTSDEDFDGQSYRNDWPGTNPNVAMDRALHPSPVLFTSPLTKGRNYPTVAFETDLPAIEVQGAQASAPFCNTSTGAHCVNPPAGAQFYPFFSTTMKKGTCNWQEGGRFIPGTVKDFGGSSKTEFGPLAATAFPAPGFVTQNQFENFNSGNIRNPCRAG
ncbi:MAG: hypothetical protein LBV78_12140 [Kitasatospora sp.]|nr:hypothetical protein [Kitasatospora sp.]